MSDLIYLSRYQNLHMDRTNPENMKQVNITVDTDLSVSSSPRLVHRYRHGYDYPPQFWGLWEVKYPAGMFEPQQVIFRGYGYAGYGLFNLNFYFYYEVDEEWVNLYLVYDEIFGKSIDTRGATARFTGYLFANDLTPQDYT